MPHWPPITTEQNNRLRGSISGISQINSPHGRHACSRFAAAAGVTYPVERVGAVRSIELARSNLSRNPPRPLKVVTAIKGMRFPPPWSIEDLGAAFVVKDSARRKLAYVYYEDEPGRRSAAKLLEWDEARRGSRRTLRSCRSHCARLKLKTRHQFDCCL
jgi:hypothetical protein